MNTLLLSRVQNAIDRRRAFLLEKYDDHYFVAADAQINKLYYQAEALIKGQQIEFVYETETYLYYDHNNRVCFKKILKGAGDKFS